MYSTMINRSNVTLPKEFLNIIMRNRLIYSQTKKNNNIRIDDEIIKVNKCKNNEFILINKQQNNIYNLNRKYCYSFCYNSTFCACEEIIKDQLY
jgi:hypothetical protein